MSYLMLVALKGSVLLAAAFVVTALLRRASAATRHLVWIAAFAGVLALPVAAMMLPSLRVPVPAAVENLLSEKYAATPVAEAEATMALTASSITWHDPAAVAHVYRYTDRRKLAVVPVKVHLPTAASAYAPPAAMAALAPSPWPMRLLLIWIFGSIMVAVAFAVGVLRTHLLACAALPAEGDLLAEEAEIIAAQLGIAREVKVVTWDGPAMPMTWGALRPVVLLPEAARQWPAARRREVLTHELAHVRRGDWTARLVAALVCALHWFNPLAWMAARRLRDEQELACDDAVVASGAEPTGYAANLLEVARSLRSPSFGVTSASVAMARPSQLTGRLLALLDESRRRAEAPGNGRLAWLLSAAFVFPLAAASPYAGPPASAKLHAPPFAVSATTAEAPRAMAVIGGVAIAVPASVECELDTRRRGGRTSASSHSNSNDDGSSKLVTLSLRQGDCVLEVRIVGTVRFNEDESDISDVARGSSIRVTEDDGGVERRFDASWRDGRLVRRFRVDGNDVPETAETRTWLAWALNTAFVRTGYNVVPRTLRAYRAGGLDSALGLAEMSGSDYSTRLMLMALIDSARVPASEAARIARVAATMSSDYERAELLIAISRRLRLDGGVQEAMVDAASRMSSDYERGRVLSAALARDDLSAAATQSLLRTAGQMSSDYEKTELLVRFLRARAFDNERRTVFFAAVNSIHSDYERRRLLSAVMVRSEIDAAVAADVIASGSNMSSDYERAELLVQVARKFGGNSSVRSLLVRATEGMSSDYEKNRVLAVLGRMGTQ